MGRPLLLVLALITVLLTTGCAKIPVGFVGIKVEQAGSFRGVQDLPLRTGWVGFNPLTESVVEYPTFMQNKVYTASNDEGGKDSKGVDESMELSSREGTTVHCDVGVNYTFIPERVPKLFNRFRQGPDELNAGFLRTQIRNHFMRYTSRAGVMDLMGQGQAAIFDSVRNSLNTELEPAGIHFEMVTFTGKPRPDAQVEAAINQVITATQHAQAARNKVAEAEAVASQMVATARGDSLSSVIRAMGRARANAELRQSLTAEIVEWEKLQKWNGVLPQVTGATAMVRLNP